MSHFVKHDKYAYVGLHMNTKKNMKYILDLGG